MRVPEVSAEARARVALSRLAEPGDEQLGRFVADLGPEDVLARVRDGSLPATGMAHYQARLNRLDVDLDLQVAAGSGTRLLVPGDAEWPPQLADLGAAEPLLLWVGGLPDLAAMTRRSVALVGSRACSAYGQRVSGDLGVGLADRGWTVVSGGAYGIDAAAHRGALAVDGRTVAVLACGVDVSYPASHEQLLSLVRRSGAVVSELGPGSRPTRRRFLDRNRLIAALGRGTVVVEAAVRSGARNTAGHADRLSRPVMAVPGPVTSTASGGCHEMIRNEGALLVTDASDVIEVVGDLGTDSAPPRRGEARPEDELDLLTLRVLESLPLRRFATPDGVGAVAGLDGRSVLRGLALLASAGLAETRNGAWRRAAAHP